MSTMTRPSIKCGSCHDRHSSVDEVRRCYADEAGNRQEHEAERATERFFEERGYEDARAQEAHEVRTGALSFGAARDRWENEPTPCSVTSPVTEDGVYRIPQTGEIFKVYHTVHGANQQVTKKLVMLADPYTKISRGKEIEVKADFIYMGKAPLRRLTASMRMTLEEAKQYGALYGVCVRCGLTLTREESIERAMGPVCAKKVNWA